MAAVTMPFAGVSVMFTLRNLCKNFSETTITTYVLGFLGPQRD